MWARWIPAGSPTSRRSVRSRPAQPPAGSRSAGTGGNHGTVTSRRFFSTAFDRLRDPWRLDHEAAEQPALEHALQEPSRLHESRQDRVDGDAASGEAHASEQENAS